MFDENGDLLPDWLDDITGLDDDLSQFDGIILALMVALNGRVILAGYNLLDRLALNGKATTLNELKANMRALIMWRSALDFDSFGLDSVFDSVARKIAHITELTNRFFSRQTVGFDGTTYNEFTAALVEQTKLRLTEAVVGSYGPLLDETLSWGVLNRATTAELRTALANKFPTDGLIPKSISQVASDALYVYSRAYSQAVAEGLNLAHYFYMGTEIATTREFCHQRIGKVFTQAEVEQWATLTWSGQIPGTTKLTIFWYAGGYRCRHRIQPISERAYQYLLNQ